MPIYAYKCETCAFAKDVLQKMSDPLLTDCPSCGAATFKKQLTAAGFQLKGSGWYVTDFKDGAGATKAAPPGESASKPAGGSDSKPEGAVSTPAAAAISSSTATETKGAPSTGTAATPAAAKASPPSTSGA